MAKIKIHRNNNIDEFTFFVRSRQHYGKLKPYWEKLYNKKELAVQDIRQIERIVRMPINEFMTK